MNQGKPREEERRQGGKGREKENLNYFPHRLKLWGKGKCALSFWVLEDAWAINEPSRVGLPDLTPSPSSSAPSPTLGTLARALRRYQS